MLAYLSTANPPYSGEFDVLVVSDAVQYRPARNDLSEAGYMWLLDAIGVHLEPPPAKAQLAPIAAEFGRVVVAGSVTGSGLSQSRMDWNWWLVTLGVPIALALVGWILTYIRYRLELRRYYGRELFQAGSGLLMALHELNNSHQGRDDFSADDDGRKQLLQRARDARDEVWRHHSQLGLIGSVELAGRTSRLVVEYNSSSPDRGDAAAPIDRNKRKQLREAFIDQWRAECPGLPGGRRSRTAGAGTHALGS